MVGSFCSTSITRHVTIVTNPVSEERTGKCLQQVEHMHSHDQLLFSSHDELSFFTIFIAMEQMHSHDQLLFSSHDELSFFTIFIAMEHMHSHDQLLFSSHDELSFFTIFIANSLGQ
jgi:hypothetical protein